MPKQDIFLTIKGKQGSGKTHVIGIIQKALTEAGYSHVNLYPIPFAEDRCMIFDDFHTIHVESIQKIEEEASNG